MGMNCLPGGGGPQEPELQVQKSSGGVFSWLGVTRQLYHQLGGRANRNRDQTEIQPSTNLTLLKAAKSPQWKFLPGGIQRPFLALLPCTHQTRQQRSREILHSIIDCQQLWDLSSSTIALYSVTPQPLSVFYINYFIQLIFMSVIKNNLN